MAMLYKPGEQASAIGNRGAAAIYKPEGSGDINVINDFTWTLTPPKGRKEIPSIQLTEFEVDESTIQVQFDFYVANAGSALVPATTDFLAPYDQLFPKDKKTGFEYTFPFYNDINFEVNTPQWASLDTLEAAKRGITEAISVISPAIGESAGRGIDFGANVIGVAMANKYPKVGIMDRPKLWTNHDFRSYTVKFPLYNTYNSDPSDPGSEWIKNRELCELLVNQNLYNKLSFITGIPPVFYEVLIPGQHYAYAACVTNLSIYNRGNIRQLINSNNNNTPCNVPDVYEVNITLTDLVIPSKNQFQAISKEPVRTASRLRGAPPPPSTTPSPTPAPSPTPSGPGGSCWVAREVYGINSNKWIIFRDWLYGNSGPKWLQKTYTKYGEKFAKFISNKPIIKKGIQYMMDIVVNKHETK